MLPASIAFIILLPLASGQYDDNDEPMVEPLPIADAYPLVFHEVGKMAMVNSFMHVLVPFNVTALSYDILGIASLLDHFAEEHDQGFVKKWGNRTLRHKYARELQNSTRRINLITGVNDNLKLFNHVLGLLPPAGQPVIRPNMFNYDPDSDLHEIKKRENALLTLASDIFGTFWGMYGPQALTDIISGAATGIKNLLMYSSSGAVSSSSNDVNEPDALPEDTNSYLEVYKKTLYEDNVTYIEDFYATDAYQNVDQIITHSGQRVRRFFNIFQSLQIHRLSADWLSVKQLKQLHLSVTKHGQKIGLVPLPDSANDYLQLETTYFRNGNELMAMVHVPCARNGQLFTVHKFIPAPLPLPKMNATHRSLPLSDLYELGRRGEILELPNEPEALNIKTKYSYIAVGYDGEHKLLSDFQLSQCAQHNRIYICDSPNYNNRHFNSSCLGSLYNMDELGVRKHCRFEKEEFVDTVVQAGTGDYFVFSPHHEVSYQVVCNNNIFPSIFKYATRVKLVPGCTLTTKQHVFNPDEHHKTHLNVRYRAWDWNIPKLSLDHFVDTTHIDKVISESVTQEEMTKFMTRFVQQRDAKLNTEIQTHEVLFGGVISAVISLLGAFTTFLYLKIRQGLAEPRQLEREPRPLSAEPVFYRPERVDRSNSFKFHNADKKVHQPRSAPKATRKPAPEPYQDEGVYGSGLGPRKQFG